MKLYGMQMSNYYNIAKLGLLEKGLAFKEIQVMPNQDKAFIKISPMGKIPVLEVDDRFISESLAILRFLEYTQPEPALFPNDPFEAGLAQQIHCYLDYYIDPAAKSLIGAAFFGKPTTPEAIAEVEQNLERAAKAINQLVVFCPFIAGENLTHADLAAVTTLPLTTQIMSHLGAEDPCRFIEGFPAYLQMMKQRSCVQRIFADRDQALVELGI